jgi:excisionase family DNA binding protein
MEKEHSRIALTTTTITTTTPSLLTVAEAAKYFRVSQGTVRKLIDGRKLGFVRIQSRILIPTTAINEYLSQNYVAPFDARGIAQSIFESKMKIGR